ncbi:MAG TPA: DUF3147 family protein [Rhodanobacteraceae bacterium]|nr:DUF3147 family protein [Rhodanobacteraceae bacterium]
MIALVVKVLLTAIIVVAVSELAKRSTLAGALLASLPLTSLLALIWLYLDTGSATQAADLARGIFWLVLPSLAFFVVFPLGVRVGWGFWTALGAGIAATLVAYGAMLAADRAFGLKLFG